ncbi:NADPH oxidase organizer 1-like [Acanthochromis polyacanthus]|uniref:NADPH oxidase organizer 1-like n=1 Tax=Acanthochromis polyacanthus TaxID=80966 RepID=UPI002234C33B|nr:NADPH oxidase organizer 1-like [Acanthochromis polyacanthus]
MFASTRRPTPPPPSGINGERRSSGGRRTPAEGLYSSSFFILPAETPESPKMTAEQRCVMSVRIIGGVQRDAPKLKMFMVSVLWSDGAEVIIYRSFQDFKKFHAQLKKRFPHLNPLNKKDRMIPKFSGKARRSSMQQKGSKKSVRQMKFLESYCDKLMKCDQTVTQSSEVTRFFMPKDHDLQPDFAKNSVMILRPDDLSDGSGGGGGSVHQQTGNVSHPFVTQTYRCVAAYETKDTKNRPFKVAVDEKLDILIKDPAGWWLVENEDKRLAWFPAPYLELLEGEDDDEVGFPPGGALYCAVKSYSTKKTDEVSVSIGTVVEVLRKSDNGWWLIRVNNKAGYIPSMYLQPYNNPRAGIYSLNRKLHSSTLNLTTSRDPQTAYPPRISEEASPQQEPAGPSRPQLSSPSRLHKAQSLDVLSESWQQTQTGPDASTSEVHERSMSNLSLESSFSDFSSQDSSSGLKDENQSGSEHRAQSSDESGSSRSSPDINRTPNTSFDSSVSSDESAIPRVPPRPKTEEILNRCTTMTRKAAMATKTRLQIQPDTIHSRL